MYKLGMQFHLHFKHAYIWLNSYKIKLKIINLSLKRDITDTTKTQKISVTESMRKFLLLFLQTWKDIP